MVVALSKTCFQVFSVAVIATAQLFRIGGRSLCRFLRSLFDERRVIAVVPIFSTPRTSATGNLFAIRTLETLEALGALPIIVTFTFACFQILSFPVVGTPQHGIAAHHLLPQRVIAVVPIFSTACALATGNRLTVASL